MGVITCDIRSLALAHRHDPTLSDLLLLHVHTDMMLRCQIFSWLWAGVEGGGWVGCNKVRWLLHTDSMLRCGPLAFALVFFIKHDHELSQTAEHLGLGLARLAICHCFSSGLLIPT